MDQNSDKSTFFSEKQVFRYNGKQMDFSRPRVMGIINLTPDSFYDGEKGRLGDRETRRKGDGEKGRWGENEMGRGILEKAGKMLEEGAYILDLGAVSTRPGAAEVDLEEETQRLLPALQAIRKAFPEALISIDTFRGDVARIAADEGADMINDISGGTFDREMIPAIVRLDIPYVIMHIRGTPRTMQVDPAYDDVVGEVFGFLLQQAKLLEETGHRKIILDPGFGFGKSVEHNYTLLKKLDKLTATGYPVLAGMSRKSMINRVLGSRPDEALNGTTVLNTIALLKGASILRVHDVKEAVEAVKLVEKMGNFEF